MPLVGFAPAFLFQPVQRKELPFRNEECVMKNDVQKYESIVLRTYDTLLADIALLLKEARRHAARSVNAILTVTYWEIGKKIVEHEQRGKERAAYGKAVLKRLSKDLSKKFGRGFSVDNLEQMRLFFQTYPQKVISERITRIIGDQSLDIQKSETPSRIFSREDLAQVLPLSWSHYVHLIRGCISSEARAFYETEALRGGWSVRQLDRQISSQFYERTLLSRNKAAMLEKGAVSKPDDFVSPEDEIKDPYVLEFLGLKDEYSESELEEALIRHLEVFLLELGSDFAFISRQKRLRIGDNWFRLDLLFYHRRLRCLVLIDLKTVKFTHSDAGQMHMYLNFAKEHWTHPEENPPVGLILCTGKDKAVAKYALGGLPNKVLAAEYRLALPDEKELAEELTKTRRMFESRKRLYGRPTGKSVLKQAEECSGRTT
jgi:predicted nuclease of restriction endonuclease-like (RecB) superfamily